MVGFNSVPLIPTVAAGVAIDTGTKGTTIRAIMVHAGATVVLRENDGAGYIRFQATSPAAVPSVLYDLPLVFKGDVYSGATGADLYQ